MSKQASDLQSQFIRDGRKNSCLDPAIPVGFTANARPEDGMSVTAYYKSKHARGEIGRFYPLHETLTFQRR